MDLELKKKLLRRSGHKLSFPEVDSFWDLFPRAAFNSNPFDRPGHKVFYHYNRIEGLEAVSTDPVTGSCFCAVKRGNKLLYGQRSEAWYVVPSTDLALANGDRKHLVSFEVILWEPEKVALVIAHYSKKFPTDWITFIEPSSIPPMLDVQKIVPIPPARIEGLVR